MRQLWNSLCTLLLLSYARTFHSKCCVANSNFNSFEPLMAIQNKLKLDCLLIIFEGHYLFKETLLAVSSPYIVVKDHKNETLEDWKRFISHKMFQEKSCVSVLLNIFPTQDILKRIEAFHSERIETFTFFGTDNLHEGEKLLVDSNLDNEGNVAVVVNVSTSQYKIFVRKIFTPQGFPEIINIDEWSQKTGFKHNSVSFFDQLNNFYGTKLRGSTLDFLPFTDYEVISDTEPLKLKISLDYFMIDEISDKLNFSYEMYRPEDGKWGTIGADGLWQGVVGDVAKRISNFSLVLSITSERMQSVDFSQIYYFDPISFVSNKKRQSSNWHKIVTPFKGEVWAIVCCTIIFSCILYLPLLKRNPDKQFIKINLTRSAMQIISSFLTQNLPYVPKNIFGRVFLGTWLFYSLLITIYYKTSLMSVLAVPPNPQTINTLNKLYHSGLQYGMIDAKGSENEMFSTSEISLHQTLFKEMMFLSSEESMKRVSEGTYAYIYFRSNLENIIASQFTDRSGSSTMHLARDSYFPGGYAWAFPKGSILRKSFDKVISRFTEGGFLNFWLKEHKRKSISDGQKKREADRNQIEAKAESNQIVLSMSHLQGAFAVLILGYSVGFLVFIVEFLMGRVLKASLLSKKTLKE